MDKIKVDLGRNFAQALAHTADTRRDVDALSPPSPSRSVSPSPRLEAAQARLAAAQRRRELAAAALEAERTSDEAQAAELAAQALDDEREAERLEHEREGEKVYRAECARRGSSRVAIVRTKLGPVVMRPMSEAEDNALSVRQIGLDGIDVYKAAIDDTLGTVLYPPAATMRAWIEEYAGLGATLTEVRRKLLDGVLEDARGKA